MTKPTFFAKYSITILVVFFFCLPFTFRGARLALRSNHNDVKEWLPDNYQETKDFRWFRKYFAGEQFVLISWEGCKMDDPRLDFFAKKLDPVLDPSGKPKDKDWLFAKVQTGPRLVEQLTKAPSVLSDDAAIDRLSKLLIGEDGQTTCALITLSDVGSQKLRSAVDTIRAIATDECGIPDKDLRLGGPPVDNVALDKSGESSLIRLATISGIVGFFVSWWCLRSPRLVFMVFTAGIFSGMLGLAIVWYSGGTVNAILLTMPSLVYVAGISGAIHLSNYYRETLAAEGPVGAVERALQHAALPIGLATGTTAVGLLSLWISDLVPIKMFGLYSAVGVVATLIPLVLILPAMLQTWPLKLKAKAAAGEKQVILWHNPVESLPWPRVGESIIRRHRWWAAACILAMVVCGYGTTKIKTSVSLMRFFADGAEIRQHYAWLEKHLGPLVPMEVVIQFDEATCQKNMLQRMQFVRRVETEIKQIDGVGSTMSAVTFAPDLPRFEGWSIKNSGLNGGLESHQGEFYKSDFLRPGEGPDEGKQLWRISARVEALRDIDYAEFIQEIRRRVDRMLDEEQALTESDTRRNAGQVTATYTGLVPLVYKAQHSLLDGLAIGFFGDWILVAVVMMIVVRDWSAGFLLMLPSAFPAAIVFGIMGWTGTIVDTGMVMTPAVALGVTVDDVVHYMLKYRKGIVGGLDRPAAIMLAYRGGAQAMYQSWSVIGLGLAVFALSPFMPTKMFGIMMVTLLTAALAGNLLMLPAMLASPLGAVFTWTSLRQRDKKLARQMAEGQPPGAAEETEESGEETADVVPLSAYTADAAKSNATAEKESYHKPFGAAGNHPHPRIDAPHRSFGS